MDARRCPAAHSMDTTWYAVDADGAVAEFSSGEDGAVPLLAAVGPEAGDFDRWPLDALLVARALSKGAYPADAGPPRPPPREASNVVLLLAEGPAADEGASYRGPRLRVYSVQDELAADVILLNDGPPRILASRRPLSPMLIAKLASDPRVERLICGSDLWDWEDAPIFRYENADYGNPGAYAREKAPLDPLLLGGAPAELRDELAKLTLPVRFAETDALHLADYLPDVACGTYGETTLRGEPRAAGEPKHSALETEARRGARTALVIIALVVAVIVLAAFLGRAGSR